MTDASVVWAENRGGKVATRDRLIRTAAELFQQRGYYAVGIAEILAKAKCPRGSLYHHFPNGKADLAIAATEWLTGEMLDAFHKARLTGRDPADFILMLGAGMGNWLEQTGWSQGSLLSVLAQEVVPQEPEISGAVTRGWSRTLAALADWLATDGRSQDEAAEMAAVVLASLMGAFTQARATQSKFPLDVVAKHLAARLRAPPGS